MDKVNDQDVQNVISEPQTEQSINTIRFQEGDELFEMEIDDGSEAARQFASDEEYTQNSDDSEQESEAEEG